MSPQRNRRHLAGAILAGVLSLIILATAGWLFFNRQFVADQAIVWSYTPPADILSLEERLRLTDKGSFYLRVTEPDIAPAAQFNQDCPRLEPGSPILGCYSSGRMYIYDVTEDRLDGIEEVTAAHEMLHAVWERMSLAERDRIGTLLKTEYQQNADEQLVERMGYYERNQPGEIINELHSIIPTEVKVISPELEEYYAQYFEDRQVVVGLYDQYSSVFTSLVAKADDLYADLAALGDSIETRSVTYNVGVDVLAQDINSFNTRANSGAFSSTAEFNQERSALVARSNELEALRVQIGEDIDRYNRLYQEYQDVAGELESLNASIDSISELKQIPLFE